MRATDYEGLSGKEKAAILLCTLGADKSAQVFKHMREEDIESITLEIANTSKVSHETKGKVLEEFYNVCMAQQYMSEGGIGYAQDLLVKAFGEKRAFDVINKLTIGLRVRSFDFLRKVEAPQIVSMLQSEGAYTIALVLSHLQTSLAAAVLSGMPVEMQADITARIAHLEGAPPEIIKDIEKVLEKRVSAIASGSTERVGGIDTVVSILNLVGGDTERSVIDGIEADDAELADEIRKKMFVFDDLVRLQNAHLQAVLREVDSSDLVLSLKMAKSETIEAILRNVSKRRRADIQDELAYLGPKKRSEIDEAQQNIIKIVRKLHAEKKIELGGSQEEFI